MPVESPLPSTILAAVDYEMEVHRSRFLAHVAPVGSVADADAVIAARRKLHWDADHHCVALIISPGAGPTSSQAGQQRSSDDGEPSGTAGAPMLEVLRRRHLSDTVAVVTRYFGGTLLGAGGLVRAYSSAVAAALDEAVIVRRVWLVATTVRVPHASAGRLETALRAWSDAHGAVFGEPSYGADVRFALQVPPDQTAQLATDVAAWSAGAVQPVFGDASIASVPV